MFPTVPTEMKDMRNTLEDIRTFVSIKVTSELEKISISVEGLEKRLQGMNYTLAICVGCNFAKYNELR